MRTFSIKNLRAALYLFLLTSCLVACGGGGGGGGVSDDLAATVEVAASPGVIDTGDRTTVTVYIDNVNQDGVAVKVRFPSGLRYILGTSSVEINGDTFAVAPTSNVSDEKNSYLVYYFSKNLFEDFSGYLVFKLLAISKVTSGAVEVDADLNDPAIDDQDEFQVATPNFAVLSSDGIVVNQ